MKSHPNRSLPVEALQLFRENNLSIILAMIPAFLFCVASCESKQQEKLTPALPGDIPLSTTAPAPAPNSLGLIGIAPTPRNFPRHKPQDVRDMIDKTAELASVAVCIYQWGDDNYPQVVPQMVRLCREAKLVPVIALSPTTLDKQRGDLDIPKRLRQAASARPTFDNKILSNAFVTAAEQLARSKPDYLCLATEINLLAIQHTQEFLTFVRVYKRAYRAVKQISNQTKVFVSFQYDFIRILDNKEPDKIKEHANVINVFRPQLDLIAITSYPCEFYESPEAVPGNYYTYLKNYIQASDKIMIMEIGWPSSGCGTAQEQLRFVQRLPVLLAELNPVITAWSLLHDVRLSAFGDDLATTGLLTTTSKPKPAWRVFAGLRNPPASNQNQP